ncbi:MAG: TrkA family potassium uptake protein [Bdellovibrionales bacterium]
MSDKKQKWFLITALIFVVVFGTVGYMIIEGWDVHESFYMTMITLTTTGFQETKRLSFEGRYFTVFLLIFGMGTVAYSISYFMNNIFASNFGAGRRKRMLKKITNLEGHIIICGFGRMGKVIARELPTYKDKLVIIESDPECIKEIENLGYYYVEGDATLDEVLVEAGVAKAKTITTMLRSDSDNLYVALASKDMNPNLVVIARANDEEAKPKLIRAGADRVVLPLAVSALKVANTIINPEIEDFLDIGGVNISKEDRIQVADVHVDEKSKLAGESLQTCGFRREGMIVIGVKMNSGEFKFAPSADYVFQRGDTLITLSTSDN